MMKKLSYQGKEKVETITRNITEESQKITSAFIFYGTKMPKGLLEKLKEEGWQLSELMCKVNV